MTALPLAFSSIAWTRTEERETFALLRAHGVTGIEIAPTTIWPEWSEASPAAARELRARWSAEGFEIPAMQAILFGRPAASLFGDAGRQALLRHLEHVAPLAGALGARVAVLGAPKQRDRGERSWEEAVEEAVPVLRHAATLFSEHGCALCIEPNPRRYGCNFVVNAREGAALVQAVDRPAFGLHLDGAALHLEGERLEDAWPEVGHLVRHFHLSEPDLGDFTAAVVPHRRNLQFLATAGYAGWCSVEMRRPVVPLADGGPWRFLAAIEP